jgi:hypothetical protein
MGGQNSARPLLVAERFGVRMYGTLSGLIMLLALPGTLLIQPLTGFLRDRMGSYVLPYAIVIVLWLVAIAALAGLGTIKKGAMRDESGAVFD